LSVQFVSKISNLCDHKSPTSQTDRRTTCDRMTALCTKEHCVVKKTVQNYVCQNFVKFSLNSWARTRGAQLSAGYTVNTYSISRCALYTCRKPARWENPTSIYTVYSADRHATRDMITSQIRGRVRAGPSFQLGTLSTRIASRAARSCCRKPAHWENPTSIYL